MFFIENYQKSKVCIFSTLQFSLDITLSKSFGMMFLISLYVKINNSIIYLTVLYNISTLY